MLDSNDGLKCVGLLSIVAIRQRLAHMPICACGTSAGAEGTRRSDVDTAIDLPDLAGDLRGALHELAAKVELSFEDGSKRRCLGPFGRAGLIIQHTIRHFLAVVDVPRGEFLRAVRTEELLAEVGNVPEKRSFAVLCFVHFRPPESLWGVAPVFGSHCGAQHIIRPLDKSSRQITLATDL